MGNILTRRQSYTLDAAVNGNLPENSPPGNSNIETRIKEANIKKELEKHDSQIIDSNPTDTSLDPSPSESKQEELADPVIKKPLVDDFVDPRSPSSYVQRTPLIESSQESKTEKDSSETPLRDSTKHNQPDNLRRRALYNDQKNNINFELPEESEEEDCDDAENINPEGSPIPKSPKKEKQSSDLSFLADKLEDLALQTPLARKLVDNPERPIK